LQKVIKKVIGKVFLLMVKIISRLIYYIKIEMMKKTGKYLEDVQMHALVLYSSLTGNTEKVAQRIERTLKDTKFEVDCIKVEKEMEIDLYHYDLIFMGSPVIQWLPTKSMIDSVTKMLGGYVKAGEVIPAAPIRVGKYAVCFCTYTGTHIGVDEAIPTTKWMKSFLGHLGYTVLDEWHLPGEFINNQEFSTKGRMGNVVGRPNEQDLKEVEEKVKGILRAISFKQT